MNQPTRKHTILLVDDEERVLAGLRRTLVGQPYTVLTTTDPNEALELAKKGEINLVISDERMPQMTGTDLLDRIRRNAPDVMRMMLTGDARLEVAMNAINMGEIYRFFTKPVDPAELLLGIHQGLQLHDLFVESRRLLDAYNTQRSALATVGTRKGSEEEEVVYTVTPPAPEDDVDILLTEIRDALDRKGES